MQPIGLRRRRPIFRSLTLQIAFWAAALLWEPWPQMVAQTAHPSLASLRQGFAHPPAEAKLRCYWWWLNGNTDKATITNDLEQMKAKGFGGALLVDANGSNQNGNKPVPPGPTFGSPAWMNLYVHALKEADRLGLEITLNITSGWNLGGPEVTPEHASKLLTFTRTDVTGGKRVALQLPLPEIRNDFYRQIAVLAYPLQHGTDLAQQPDDGEGDRHANGEVGATKMRAQPSTLRFRSAAAEAGFSMPDATGMLDDGITGRGAQSAVDPAFSDTPLAAVQDLTSSVDGAGNLAWAAPSGKWEVLRIGYTDSDARVSTSSGAWQGLAIDYLNRDAFEEYWQHTVEPLITAARPFRSLRYLATDSWELGGTNWTTNFREQFLRLRGYDPVPWLPVIAGRIVSDRSQSTRFLTDLRRTVADLVVSEHYDIFAAKARERGLGVQAESGGPHGAPIDALETFRLAAVPQTEFWSQNPHRNTDPERFFTKQAASAAHIYGQRFVAQEGETSIGPQWSESLATDLKPSFDMAITEGMNRLIWHEFTSSPASTGLPGQEYFAGTHLNPKVTWWNAGGAFFDYLNRVQFLMQQGTAVNDVLYFYGDNVPNFVRLKSDDPAHVLPGYDYDVTDEDALLHTVRIDGGRLRGPSGVEWKLLALPNTGRISLAVLKRVETYVRQGGVIVSPPPSSTTGLLAPKESQQFAESVSRIWGANCASESHHAYGKGQIFCTYNTRAALAALNVPPDVTISVPSSSRVAASTSEVDYIHRRVGSVDIYFLRNGSDHTSQQNVLFRAGAGVPELWDAVSADTAQVPVHSPLPDGRTQISLTLAPFGSAVLVFTRTGTEARTTTLGASTRTLPVNPLCPWSVSFQHDRGAPASSIEVTDLKSWTEWPQRGVRFFSGTATYRTRVTAPPLEKNEAIWLTFEDVREIARVKVNGHEAGTIWAKPAAVRVEHLLHPGENTLDIEVTNLWPNRIIGDLQPDATAHFTETNITAYSSSSPLLPSGLIGPVQWTLTTDLPTISPSSTGRDHRHRDSTKP